MLTKTRVNLHMSPAKSTSIATTPTTKSKSAGLVRLAAAQLAVAGWLGMSLPSPAATITTGSNTNPYRSCAGRLVRAGVSAEAAASACAGALNPPDIGRCVARIEQQTEIAAQEALATCRQVRRPIELARCVVGISDNTRGQAVPGVLDYCSRSLLPVRYAECVVGLQREIDLAPKQALETCISASNRPLEFSPTFIPEDQNPPVQPAPASTQPQNQTSPVQPAPAPTQPQNQTPPVQPAPAPTQPQNQTSPAQPAPAPATP